MRAPYALVASVLSLACVPVSAQATPTRACGKVGGYIVRSDQRTTTCGLARNAARNFLAGFGALGHAPRYIHGHSPKTGLTYRLRRATAAVRLTGSTYTYVGRTGQARLFVWLRYPMY